jgi:hypothetical protein
MAAATPIRIAIDDLDLATLKSEINEGHSVDLVRGESVVAEVRTKPSLDSLTPPQRAKYEAIMARLRRDFPHGSSLIDSTAIIREDRDSRG